MGILIHCNFNIFIACAKMLHMFARSWGGRETGASGKRRPSLSARPSFPPEDYVYVGERYSNSTRTAYSVLGCGRLKRRQAARLFLSLGNSCRMLILKLMRATCLAKFTRQLLEAAWTSSQSRENGRPHCQASRSA